MKHSHHNTAQQCRTRAATAEDARLKRIAAMCGHPDAAEACRLILAEVQEAMTEQDPPTAQGGT